MTLWLTVSATRESLSYSTTPKPTLNTLSHSNRMDTCVLSFLILQCELLKFTVCDNKTSLFVVLYRQYIFTLSKEPNAPIHKLLLHVIGTESAETLPDF